MRKKSNDWRGIVKNAFSMQRLKPDLFLSCRWGMLGEKVKNSIELRVIIKEGWTIDRTIEEFLEINHSNRNMGNNRNFFHLERDKFTCMNLHILQTEQATISAYITNFHRMYLPWKRYRFWLKFSSHIHRVDFLAQAL